jgi:hypothetical protein
MATETTVEGLKGHIEGTNVLAAEEVLAAMYREE